MKKLILILSLATLVGCSSAQLAKDEALAQTALTKIDALASDPNAVAKINAAADDLVALDPNSAFLQKTAAAIKKNATAGNQAKLKAVTVGTIELLGTVAPVAS